MKWITTLSLALLAVASFGQEAWAKKIVDASPRHQEWVKVKAGDRSVDAFVVYPEVKEKAPVVIVIHEIFGMSDWVEYVADRLAEEGYIAIAPDLLSGMGPKGGRTNSFTMAGGMFDVGKAREAVSKLPQGQVTTDLLAVADYGKALPASNGKLAVAGFCWGGTQSFLFATNRSDLSATFVFYGSGPADISKINSPVYGFYAGNDGRINMTIPDTQSKLRAAGKKFEPEVYDDAGHGFMRAGGAPDASEENMQAMTDGWKRWLELLAPLKE